MTRRNFILHVLGATLYPLTAHATQPMPVIGMLNSGPPTPRRDQIEGFYRGLKDAGYVAGENVSIVQRGASDQYDRLPELAADLVRQRVAVIAAIGGPVAALAAKAATSTISIVFAAV